MSAKRGISSFLTKDEMLRFAQHDRMEGHDRMEDVAPSLFFVAPSEARGPSALACLGRTRWEMSPRTSFFVAPRRQPRGPSALARLGKTSRRGRRPERSEGCLAIARQDKVGRGLF
jgi:hypothetical protein